jgi:hypothetical protein
MSETGLLRKEFRKHARYESTDVVCDQQDVGDRRAFLLSK